MSVPDYATLAGVQRLLTQATVSVAMDAAELLISKARQHEAIRAALADGMSITEVARITGMSRATIYKIKDAQ